MGARIPQALAGSDNEVEMDEDGARTVVELIAGTTLAAGIVAAGGLLFGRVQEIIGQNQNISDLY